MFDVLVFVYENYYTGDHCPQPEHLGRKLSAVGFASDEIDEALVWLDGLHTAARGIHPLTDPVPSSAMEPWLREPSATSMRIYPASEQRHLGGQCLGFIRFMESAGMLSAPMREVVIDRAMACSGSPVSLEDLKIIILMVYWSFGREPDAWMLDELFDATPGRVAH